jgi:hypothetical protein
VTIQRYRSRSCCRTLVVKKLRAAWVKQAPPGSFDSAPQALCQAIRL